MAGDFFMTKRQPFTIYYCDGVSLKNIKHLLGISYRTCIRWKQLHCIKQLVIPHGLKGKIGNKTSSINHHTIMCEALDSPKFLLKAPGKGAPTTCNYVVQSKLQAKCSCSPFKKRMTSNLIASPWASSKTKKPTNKLLRVTTEHITEQKIKKQMQIIIDCNQKSYLRKPRPKYEGEIGKSDACKDYWSSSSYARLHAVYDPVVKKLKALYLGKEATTHHDYEMLEIMLQQGELPQLCRGDCRSSFVINKKDAGALAYKDVHPQFGFVLKLLGVKMEKRSAPTFKGGMKKHLKPCKANFNKQ